MYLLVFIITFVVADPISSINYLGMGLDAKTSNYALAPIFEYTYNQNKKFNTFDVPDQMAVQSYESSQESVVQGAYSSYTEYLHKFSEWFSFDIGIGSGIFSMGFEYNKILAYVYDQINKHENIVVNGHYVWTYYDATLYPSYVLKFDPIFKKAIDLLPKKIVTASDLNYVKEFVQTFGTHFVEKGVFGGKVDFHAGLNKNYVSKYSASEVFTQYGLYFHYNLFDVSNGGFSNKSDINIDVNFLENVESETFFYGGDPTLANLNNLSKWVNSIKINTYPLNATLVGLWNLIDDINKQKMLHDYIINYISPNYLKNADVHPCLGSGIDETTLQLVCLNNIYHPTIDTTFETLIPESQLVEFSVVMQEDFSIDAYYHEKTESDGILGFGSSSEEVYRFYKNYYSEKKSLTKIILSIAFTKFTSPVIPFPEHQLDPMFVLSLNKLPRYNKSDTRSLFMFQQFIQTWGTAVIDEITLGGFFESSVWYDNMFNSVYSEERVSQSSHWSFAGIIGDGHGTTSDNYYIDKEFNATMQMEYVFVGGNITMKQNQYLDWASTVQNSPNVIKYHSVPITYFILDPVLKQDVSNAIINYGKNSSKKLNDFIKSISNQQI